VGWGCVVESCGCVVGSSFALAMVAIGPGIVVVASSSSAAGVVGVIVVMSGVSLGLGIFASVVGEVQHAGVLLHVGVTTWQGAA